MAVGQWDILSGWAGADVTALMEFGGATGAAAWVLLVGAVATALLALAALLRGAWRGARRLVALVDLVEVVEERTRELRPNSGHSIKDRSDQMAGRMSRVESGLRRMEGQVGALARTLDAHLNRGED